MSNAVAAAPSERFTSSRVARSNNRSGPVLTTTTSATIRTSRTMWQSAPWPSNGCASSIAAGRTANPMTKRSICSLCADAARCLRESSGRPPTSGGSRWPASKDSLKITLDGLAQKTPLTPAVEPTRRIPQIKCQFGKHTLRQHGGVSPREGV